MIFFSVILPAYNRAYLIAETIDSVLQQTFPDFELLIIDDGSTDNTQQLIESKYAKDTRIKYFYKENEERAAARNFGLKQAKGEYAVFLDSDDWMKLHYLETLKKIIEKNEGIILLAAKYNYKNNGIEEVNSDLQKLDKGWYGRNLFLTGNILACNYCIKIKNHSIKLFPADRSLTTSEDWLFLLANLQNEKIFISNEICISMRQHNDRSMNNNQKVIAARKKATEWIIENLNLTVAEISKLKAWSHYFCAVHQYLDHNRAASVNEIMAAIKQGGINNKFLLLFLKSIIGRKIIKKLR